MAISSIFLDLNFAIERPKNFKFEFNLIDKMIAPNGVILADNILSHYEKVEDYVDNLFNRADYQSQILDLGAGMMLSRKN